MGVTVIASTDHRCTRFPYSVTRKAEVFQTFHSLQLDFGTYFQLCTKVICTQNNLVVVDNFPTLLAVGVLSRTRPRRRTRGD